MKKLRGNLTKESEPLQKALGDKVLDPPSYATLKISVKVPLEVVFNKGDYPEDKWAGILAGLMDVDPDIKNLDIKQSDTDLEENIRSRISNMEKQDWFKLFAKGFHDAEVDIEGVEIPNIMGK